MSEPKLIQPLLEGFVMGDPISDHDGVRCCPAMQTDRNNKYIVKIISVPASQIKLDALLLAGAFRDRDAALSYFKDLSEGIVEEAVLLQRLSRLEGFLSYDNWQVVPMENGETGYDIYLVGSYRTTLERQLRRGNLSHLNAVNLGLDLCAALAVCRRSGYLYVDLKPGNVYAGEDKEYRIGDLGFAPLSSLEYASLPERYFSAYTAPEIADAYDPLNATLDIYALGLILYQVFNGGALPFEGRAPKAMLLPPEFADPDMAEIILKACAPDPADRWQDPMQMGQALVNYMQEHSVNDTPIVPVPAEPEPEVPEEPEITAEEAPDDRDPSTEDILAEVDQALEAALLQTEEAAPAAEEEPSSPEEEAPSPAEEAPQEEAAAAEEPVSEGPAPAEEVSSDLPEEESDLSAEAAALQEALGVTQEVSQILAQADDLIAHETPDPVVAPEPIDIPIPEPILPDQEQPPEEAPAQEEAPVPAAAPAPEETLPEEVPAPKRKKKHVGLWVTLICLVLIAAMAFGGYFYYQNYYLQTIYGITLNGLENQLTVSIDTEIEDSLLTVYCTDTYGNTTKQSVVGGKALFADLNPATRYKVSVQISGFHKLIGVTTGVYTTAQQTSIVSFTTVTGAEDGSVILNFTVQGPEPGEWKVSYSAEGEEEKSLTFTGHMVTVNGLSVGKKYTFRVEPATALYFVGENTVEHVASAIVYAENLEIKGFHDSTLRAEWTVPEGMTVESWTVRCYNDSDFDKTVTVTDTFAEFEVHDISTAYTVEVNAIGMTQGTRAYVSANSVTVTAVQVDDTNPNQLTVTWDYEGSAPQNGWLLLYTVGQSQEQQVVQCSESTGVISPAIPGEHYDFTILPASGSTVFGGLASFDAPAAETFSGYLLTAGDILFSMCNTPEKADWTQYDVLDTDYTTTFAVGSKASFAVYLNHEYNTSSDEIVTMFLIRDADGQVYSTATESRTWTSMWYRGFGRLNIPSLPDAPGTYTLEIYFNGAIVSTQSFTMTEAATE